jgi:hypothetical protein
VLLAFVFLLLLLLLLRLRLLLNEVKSLFLRVKRVRKIPKVLFWDGGKHPNKIPVYVVTSNQFPKGNYTIIQN